MKKKHLVLAVLAIVLVLCSSIGAAVAYFTTYSDARGGYVIHLGHKTTIKESVEGSTKTIQIANVADPASDAGKYPLFIRVKVFAGTDCEIDETKTSDGWLKAEDAYYYQDVLYAGDGEETGLTTPLSIKVKAASDTVEAGDVIDVIVVYESVPAVFTPDGSPDFSTAWTTGKITPING